MTAIAAGSESVAGMRDERRPGTRSLVTWLALAAVAFTFAASGIVFTEPAPVDALSIGLIVLLPTIGLVAFNRALLAYGSLWLVAGACALLAATFSLDPKATLIHVAVTLYLYAASVVIAAFVARSPRFHTELIFKAWTVAAIVAGAAAIIGYFGLLPGAFDLFTLYGRAAGTFKDPNVFGPFCVVPLVYLLSIALQSQLRGMIIPLAIAAFLMLGVFLSFSRGAWLNLVVALAIYGYLALATSRKSIVRLKIVGLLAAGSIIAVGVVLAAMSSDNVAELLAQRATLDQSYDTGAEGRFGGQQKAIELVAEHPLGDRRAGVQQPASHRGSAQRLPDRAAQRRMARRRHLPDPRRPDAGARLPLPLEGVRGRHAPVVPRRLRDICGHGARGPDHRQRPLAPLLRADGHRLGLRDRLVGERAARATSRRHTAARRR